MNRSHPPTPGLAGILETCVYYSEPQREQVERFYLETLGLQAVARRKDVLACRLATGMLLVFGREAVAERDGPITAHGSDGPSHVCLLAADAVAYGRWRERLETAGVEITHQQTWPGGRSFYFHDPAGNLLEIADTDIWPSGERGS